MKSRILVLHSGSSGDARESAFCVAGKLHANRCEIIVADMAKYLVNHILTERTLLLCLENPVADSDDEFSDFIDFPSSLDAGSLDGLQYSVLCIGHTAPDRRHDPGHQLDSLLETLGARRIARLMDCPAQFRDRLHVWTETISVVLRPESGNSGGTMMLEVPCFGREADCQVKSKAVA